MEKGEPGAMIKNNFYNEGAYTPMEGKTFKAETRVTGEKERLK